MKKINSKNWYEILPRKGDKRVRSKEFDLEKFYKLADKVKKIFEEEEEYLEQEQRKNQTTYPNRLL